MSKMRYKNCENGWQNVESKNTDCSRIELYIIQKIYKVYIYTTILNTYMKKCKCNCQKCAIYWKQAKEIHKKVKIQTNNYNKSYSLSVHTQQSKSKYLSKITIPERCCKYFHIKSEILQKDKTSIYPNTISKSPKSSIVHIYNKSKIIYIEYKD